MQANGAEQEAKRSALIQEQVKQHMAENEELKSMPDPNQVVVSTTTEPEPSGEA